MFFIDRQDVINPMVSTGRSDRRPFGLILFRHFGDEALDFSGQLVDETIMGLSGGIMSRRITSIWGGGGVGSVVISAAPAQ